MKIRLANEVRDWGCCGNVRLRERKGSEGEGWKCASVREAGRKTIGKEGLLYSLNLQNFFILQNLGGRKVYDVLFRVSGLGRKESL